MQTGHRTVWAFVIFNAAMALLVLAIHFWPGNNSMLNLNSWDYMNPEKGLNEVYLEEVISYHQTEPTFARRRLTTTVVMGLHQVTGLTKGQSFVLFNFIVLWLTGIVISISALFQSKKMRTALLSGLLFWLSFPVLFAFFPTIYSYDDPLLYFFLAMTLLAIKLGNQWSAAAMFALAIVTRESAVIMLPGIMLLYNDGFKLANLKTSWKKWWPFLVVSVLYLAGLFWLEYGVAEQSISHDASRRFATFFYNFQNKQFGAESVFSFVLVCILALSTWLNNGRGKRYRQAFFLTLVLNTAVVLVFTQARESRLFILPLFFWFPYAGELLIDSLQELLLMIRTKKWYYSVGLSLYALFAGWIVYQIYEPTAMRSYENWHQEYLFVLVTFTALIHQGLVPKSKRS